VRKYPYERLAIVEYDTAIVAVSDNAKAVSDLGDIATLNTQIDY